MKTENPKTGYGERDTEDLKFALMKKSWIVVSRGNGNGALGGEDGRIRSRLDKEGNSISDVGYQLNGWGSGRYYVTVRSRIRGTIKSRFGGVLGQDFGICRTAIFCMLMSFLMNGSLGLKL